MANRKNRKAKRGRKRRLRRLALISAGLVTLAEAITVGSRRGSMFGIRAVVRCQEDHLFTTVWIPGASAKAMRLGPWRFQRCPVGSHWSIVTPVRVSELTEEQRELARTNTDGLVP